MLAYDSAFLLVRVVLQGAIAAALAGLFVLYVLLIWLPLYVVASHERDSYGNIDESVKVRIEFSLHV